jgi:HK97 family phage major capsid protein
MNFDITDAAPEHKAGFSTGSRDDYDELRHTFEEFKAANDERLAVIEHKRADVLLEEKVDRINQALDAQHRRLDDLALRQVRPSIDGIRRQPRDGVAREHKSAFDAYVRAGDVDGLRQIETKAMSVGSNADGGYLVPVELEHAINQRVMTISPIRSIASVREISGNVYKKPFMTAGPATGWVGETDARTQTTSATFDALSFPAMELYSTIPPSISTNGWLARSNSYLRCRKPLPS